MANCTSQAIVTGSSTKFKTHDGHSSHSRQRPLHGAIDAGSVHGERARSVGKGMKEFQAALKDNLKSIRGTESPE